MKPRLMAITFAFDCISIARSVEAALDGSLPVWAGVSVGPAPQEAAAVGCETLEVGGLPGDDVEVEAAEKAGTVFGLQTCHEPLQSTCGSSAVLRSTVNIRICGRFAAAVSASTWMQPFTVMAMLDCPEPSHTSPTSTSLISSAFLPRIFSTEAAPGSIGASFTDHLPAESATAVLVCAPSVTVTCS